MSEDVTRTESSPVEAETATTPVEVESAAAEPENTGTPPAKENVVPDRRFQEVIAQKNEALKEKEQLAARVKELERSMQERTKEPEPAVEDLEPPAHLTQKEQVRWLIEKHAENLIKQKTGMNLEQLGTAVSTTRNTAEDYAERKFSEMCGERGLDSKSKDVRDYIQVMLKGGADIVKALDTAKRLYGTAGTTTASGPVATVETDGVTGVMTQPSRIPKNVREAVEMAARGEAAKQLSTTELLERKAKERSSAQRTN